MFRIDRKKQAVASENCVLTLLFGDIGTEASSSWPESSGAMIALRGLDDTFIL
jgi:hypothetical protein